MPATTDDKAYRERFTFQPFKDWNIRARGVTYLRGVAATCAAFPVAFVWIGGFLTGSASPAVVTVVSFPIAAVVALAVGVIVARFLAGIDTPDRPLKHQLSTFRTELWATPPPKRVVYRPGRADPDEVVVVDAAPDPNKWSSCEDALCPRRDR